MFVNINNVNWLLEALRELREIPFLSIFPEQVTFPPPFQSLPVVLSFIVIFQCVEHLVWITGYFKIHPSIQLYLRSACRLKRANLQKQHQSTHSGRDWSRSITYCFWESLYFILYFTDPLAHLFCAAASGLHAFSKIYEPYFHSPAPLHPFVTVCMAASYFLLAILHMFEVLEHINRETKTLKRIYMRPSVGPGGKRRHHHHISMNNFKLIWFSKCSDDGSDNNKCDIGIQRKKDKDSFDNSNCPSLPHPPRPAPSHSFSSRSAVAVDQPSSSFREFNLKNFFYVDVLSLSFSTLFLSAPVISFPSTSPPSILHCLPITFVWITSLYIFLAYVAQQVNSTTSISSPKAASSHSTPSS